MLYRRNIAVATDGEQILAHLFVTNPHIGLIIKVKDVERLGKRFIDESRQVLLAYPSKHMMCRTNRQRTSFRVSGGQVSDILGEDIFDFR